MVSLDHVVTTIQGLSGAQDLQQLLSALRREADDACKLNVHAIPAAIQSLDPQQHSLGMLFLLHGLAAHGLNNQQLHQGFVELATRFMRSCSAHQIQMAPEQMCGLSRKLRDHLLACGHPRLGILPLTSALERLRPSPEHLTPIHQDVLLLCLQSKCYNAATPILDQDVFEVEPDKVKVTVQDFLLYCYYGGMAATGRKRYARALELWLAALTAPTMVASAITSACYKKYVLASLIHTGALKPLPKFVPQKVRQMVELEGRAYAELASTYASHSAEKLRRIVDHHSAHYHQDGNLGLVRQVVASLQTRNVQRLTATYLTLSLGVIATSAGLAGPAEAEAHVLRMVAAGEVHAQINERDGMVAFVEDLHQSDGSATAARIDTAIAACARLSDRLTLLHERVSLDRTYVNKMMVMRGDRNTLTPEELAGGAGMLYQP